MITFSHKLFVLFLITSQVCFGQGRDISKVFIEPHYRELDLSESQKEIIFHADDSLKKMGSPAFKTYTALNALTYSLLSGEQRVRYDSIYRDYWFRINKNFYDYLNLTDEQVLKLVTVQSGLLTSDSIRSFTENNLIINKTIYNILDSMQIILYNEREKWKDQNQRKLRVEGEAEKKKQADFEIKRLGAVKKYHKKFLSKSKARVLDQIRLDNPADALKLEEMENKYQTRTHASEKVELYYCYAEDGGLLAPETEKYIKAKYEVRRYQPSLCLYWCSMGGNVTVDFIEEEEWMYKQLEYFKSTYPSIIEKELMLLEKGKVKLNKAIDKFRPEKYKGTTVTIVAEERVQALEKVAELLLTH